MADDLKKKDLLAALAGIDAAAEQVTEEAKVRGMDPWVGSTLDSARFFSEPVRLAVDRVREETGDFTHDALVHERARRLHREFTGEAEPGWEVKGWREVERLETGERVFEVQLLGTALPVDGEELIPVERRSDEPPVEFLKIANRTIERDEPVTFDVDEMEVKEGYFLENPSDFCRCGHTRGTHRDTGLHSCLVEGCGCEQYKLMASGIEGVEESPPDPHRDLTIASSEEEGHAITFLRQITSAAGTDEPDPETWMGLQRLLSAGWRITPPPQPED